MENVPLKSRAQGAVNSERMQLLSIIAHHWDEIENYELSGCNPKNKWDVWEKIANEFNSHPCVTVTRSPLQVKTLYKNMKTKAKKYKTKLDASKSSGVTVESDLVSEIVLQLTEFQSKESLNAFLEFLKNLRYFDPKSKMSVTPEDEVDVRTEIVNSRESSMSPDWKLATNCEDVPDIKEEVIEAFDSPCIIREDESPLSFSNNDEKSDDGSCDLSPVPVSESNINSTTESVKPSEVHTFGDISVTPLSNENKKTPNGLKIVSPDSLGINTQNQNKISDTPKSTNCEAGTVSNRVILQPKSVLNKTMSVGLLNLSNLIDRETLKRSSLNNDSLPQHNKHSQNIVNSLSEKYGKQCCCPDYHKRMMTLAKKEHEMTVSLLNEKILAKREERRLHEEERKFREQTFLLKQEERRVSLAEHQARLKLIELECEAAQKRFRSNDRINKWLLRNGSKEI